jgi:hypothetical protein
MTDEFNLAVDNRMKATYALLNQIVEEDEWLRQPS